MSERARFDGHSSTMSGRADKESSPRARRCRDRWSENEEVESMDRQADAIGAAPSEPQSSALPLVIVASSLGTMIEWYDFYIFGSLAAVLSVKFYPPGNDTFALIAY